MIGGEDLIAEFYKELRDEVPASVSNLKPGESASKLSHRVSIGDNSQPGEGDIVVTCHIDGLTGETPVWIRDSSIPVENLATGDRVLASNGEHSLISRFHVTATNKLADEMLRVSSGHQFMLTDGTWVAARDHSSGDSLVSRSEVSSFERLESIAFINLDEPVLVYDVRLESGEPLLVGAAGLKSRGASVGSVLQAASGS